MTISTFQRYEKKFLITDEQRKILLPIFLDRMNYDEYCLKNESGKYTIYNIYYDTENSDVIRENANARSYKEKLRLRSYYPVDSEDDKVFVELKKKENGVGNKRRIKLPFQDAKRLIDDRTIPVFQEYLPNQVAKEIGEYLRVYRVIPTLYLQYDRIALFGKENPEFRLTIDDNIRTRRSDFGFYPRDDDFLLLEPGTHIMEIKFLGSMPMWLSGLLSEQGLFSRGFSKYGTEYKFRAKQRELHYSYEYEKEGN